MATRFTTFNTETGEEKEFGTQFFGGQERGTTFEFFGQPEEFEGFTHFRSETGQEFTRTEFFEEFFGRCQTFEFPEQ